MIQALDSTARQAALAAVLALRASLSLGMPVRSNSVLVANSHTTDPVSDEIAAESLADMAKPVNCHAEARGDNLLITCEAISGDPLRSHEEDVARLLPGFRQLDQYPKNQDALLLLRGRDEGMVLTVRAFERWCLDYVLPLGLAMTGRSPLKEQVPRGVRYEFVLSKPEPLDR